MRTTDNKQPSQGTGTPAYKRKPYRNLRKKPEEARAEGIPMLKYGNGNNFYEFKQALSEVAIRYYTPNLWLPDYATMEVDSTYIPLVQT